MLFNSTAIDIIEKDLIALDQTPFLVGPPGIGKTSVAKAIAKRNNARLFMLQCNLIPSPEDLLRTKMQPTEDGGSEQIFIPHLRIGQAIEYANAHPDEKVILLEDELNRADPDAVSGLLAMPTERSIGTDDLPPNLLVIATGNDSGNVKALDAASVSRFSIYRLMPHAPTLIKHFDDDDLNMHPAIRATLTKHPETVYCTEQPATAVAVDPDDDPSSTGNLSIILEESDEKISQFTTPRTIEYANQMLNAYTPDELRSFIAEPTVIANRAENVLREMLEGKLGNTAFVDALMPELMDHLMSLAPGGSAATTSIVASRTALVDQLLNVKTMSDLEQIVQGAADEERSHALLYLLTQDIPQNTKVIPVLAQELQSVDRNDMPLLTALAQQGDISASAFVLLQQSTGQAASMISMILQNMGY